MKRLFDPNTPMMRLLAQAADLAVLNVLWLLCCLPVVTIGASTSALYRATLNMARERGAWGFRVFFQAFRENFRRATALWLILLAALVVIAGDLWISYAFDFTGKTVFLVLVPAGLLLWLIVSAYVFPMTAQFDNTVKNTLFNAAAVGLSHPLRSLLMAGLNVLPFVMAVISFQAFARFLVFWLLLGFGVTAYVNSLILRKLFAPYMPGE